MSDKAKIFLHRNDLPDGLDLGTIVAIDSETMGLHPVRDRLCLVQLSAGDGNCHLVKFDKDTYEAPNLKRLLTDPRVLKIFHYARFDVAAFMKYLNIRTAPVYCTKIAAKMVRTFTNRHGLKGLCSDLLGIELSKEQQSSDWGADNLTEAQMTYAANDVLYLHRLKAVLEGLLAREGRTELAQACYDFLPARAELDLLNWAEPDIFTH